MTSRFQPLRTRFQEVDARFRSYSMRERALLGAMLAGAFFFAIDQFLIQPVTAERERTALGLKISRDSIVNLQAELDKGSDVELSPEDKRILDETRLITTQIQEIGRQMQSTVASLVPPEAIVSVLEELFVESETMKIVSLQSHSPTRVGGDEPSDEIAATDASLPIAKSLYRHGLTMQIEGGYLETLEYLRRVEDSSWNLLWERLEYQVETYPTARITIDLHTISDHEEWLGV